MTKRILALFIALIMCLSLVACGGDKADAQGEGSKEADETTSVTLKTIDITLDNWQEYFEIRESKSLRKNDFDEIEAVFIGYRLYVKEEYAGKITDSDVAIGYLLSEPMGRRMSYNCATDTITLVKELSDEDIDELGYATYNVPDEGTSKLTGTGENGAKIGNTVGGWTASYTTDGDIVTWDCSINTKVEITRIEGTITIAE